MVRGAWSVRQCCPDLVVYAAVYDSYMLMTVLQFKPREAGVVQRRTFVVLYAR